MVMSNELKSISYINNSLALLFNRYIRRAVEAYRAEGAALGALGAPEAPGAPGGAGEAKND